SGTRAGSQTKTRTADAREYYSPRLEAEATVTAGKDVQQDDAAAGGGPDRAETPAPPVAVVAAQAERLDLHLEAGRLQLMGGIRHRHADHVRDVDLGRA